MTTNTMTSPLSMGSGIMPNTDHGTANGADLAETPHHEEDNRSSSLSEIGERAEPEEAENAFYDGSDADDTEAETERLENSPQKLRNHQDVMLTSTSAHYEVRSSPLSISILPLMAADKGPNSDADRMGRTSEISSLADSGEDNGTRLSASPFIARKRKRSSSERGIAGDQDLLTAPTTKAARIFRSTSAGALVEDPSLSEAAEEHDHEIAVDTVALRTEQIQLQKSLEPALPQQTYQKGKRKGRRIRGDEPENKDKEIISARGPAKREENQQAVYSNEEDCENDDTGDVPEADNAVKNEEGALEKKYALNSLNAMEKFFATFRDKLFDERLSQCNEELAMLESATPLLPELVAMKDAIDQRRDQKLKYEQNLMKYKLQTLQRESIANKAQAHSQYMQTVREIRDSSLEKLNKEFYQLQRERRSVDGDVPDYVYEFSTERPQQIKHQTAYNAEVSILSGFAKYVGFPAAPDVSQAKPKEIEDDLRSMGIPSHVPQIQHSHPVVLRAMSNTSTFSRQRFGADEHFMEQNPWANPQHPSHHQQRQLHRQVSDLSRAATPSSTPAAQRRLVGLTQPQGPACTVPDHPLEPNSPMAASNATGEAVKLGQYSQAYAINNHIHEPTSSRVSGISKEATAANSAPFEASKDRGKGSQPSKLEQSHSPALPRTCSQDTHTPKALPKPLPFLHTGGRFSATPGPRTSAQSRYPVVKAEDQGHVSRQSPMPQYHIPPVSTVANGQMNRFAP